MADIAELIVALKLRDGVSSGLGNLNRQLSGMNAGLSNIGTGIGQVGRGFDTIVTRGAIAAAAGIGAVVTAAVSFEDAFAGVRKTVDASEDQLLGFEDQLREMARTIPLSFEELAGIAEQGGALGIAFEGLDEFTRVVADLANTTDLTADAAATSLGVLGNVLGLSAEDFDNFGSALVDLGNKGASTESQILGIAERAGAAGDLIGLSADQVLGFGAAAANLGIDAEAGGTALQKFFIDSLTAVEEGGAGLETFARVAGQSAEDFQTAFREDAGAALADFIEGLGQLPEAVQIETLQDLGFNDVRITRLLLGLASDADGLTDSLTISSEAFAENSALGVEAAKRYATTASQLKILKQNVTDAAVTIGDELLPVVGELTSDLVEFLNKPETRTAIKEFGENLAGGIRDFADEIRKADFGPLIDTMKGAAGFAKTAFDAFRSLPAPIQQLALAAIVANKVTGGAVGQIAGGLGSILKGVIQIGFERGSSPANPLFVSAIGGGLGGPGGIGGGAGGVPVVLGTAGAVAAGVAAGLAVGLPIYEAAVGPAKELFTNKVDEILDSEDISRIRDNVAILDEELAKWATKPPQVREAAEGFITELQTQRDRLASALPKFGPPLPPFGNTPIGQFDPRNLGGVPSKITLPDTAMRPLLTPLEEIRDAIREQNESDEPGNFVPDVRLNPERINDIRIETAQTSDHLRELRDTLPRFLGGIRADVTDNKNAISQRLAEVSGKVAGANVNLNAANQMLRTIGGSVAPLTGRLDTSNFRLSAIENKNWSPQVYLTNQVTISATLLEQRLITAKIAAQGSSATGAQLTLT